MDMKKHVAKAIFRKLPAQVGERRCQSSLRLIDHLNFPAKNT